MTDDDITSPPRSFLARSREFAKLAARVSGHEIGHRLNAAFSKSPPLDRLRVQVLQAGELVQSLGRLKGAAMKVGQLLSIEGADFLPPEVIEILGQLRDSGAPMPPSTVTRVLRTELGDAKFGRLTELSLQPLASASIGQVHRARLDGQDLALKIQFPGIADTIDSDLALLKKALGGFLAISRKDINIGPLMEELDTLLKQEVNYAIEADHLEAYRAGLAKYGLGERFVIPRVFREFSTERVLAMSYEPGLRVPDWLRTNPAAEARNEFGQLLLDLYQVEFFRMGLVQTDPNFSNFYFRPEERKIVLLDFGATRAYDAAFRADYVELLKLMRDGTDAALLEKSVAMALVNPSESRECLEAYVSMLRLSVEPFNPRRQPFAFADADYSNEVRGATMAFTGKIRVSEPPRQLIFLHRKLGGVFSLLKTIDARLDLLPYWERLSTAQAAS